MTREEAKRIVNLYSIIEAYANGETIEVFNEPSGEWKEYEKYSFACAPEHYRIKPKPKFRPFKNSSECWEEMKKHKPFGWITNDAGDNFMVVHTTEIGYTLCNNMFQTYLEAQNIGQKFIDGTPFGVKEE